jgi:hypothetical protein
VKFLLSSPTSRLLVALVFVVSVKTVERASPGLPQLEHWDMLSVIGPLEMVNGSV